MAEVLRLMFIGDVMGQPGQMMFAKWVPRLKEKHKIDAIIVNGENAAKNGKGLKLKDIEFLKQNGADVITSGNHIWYNNEIYSYLNEKTDLLRPENYPSDCPGKGYTLIQVKNYEVAIVNIQGRSFLRDQLSCPFKTTQSLLTFLETRTKFVFVDFHAEATAEKQAFAFFMDGKVTGVFGTHTHVQTADERILPNGTCYITDLGFCGALNSIIGMEKDSVIQKFLTQMPFRFKVEKNSPFILSGIWVEVCVSTAKPLKIVRINVIDEEFPGAIG
ncbi:TIGR00282 family metallophosphoesterase [Candidatus Babeliales bacterium]|nr:TIGR00282 family metallophosphoesterase [Candidatus Babeliales bacterium]